MIEKMARMEKPWRDEEVLRFLYEDEGKTQEEISDTLGCSVTTVSNWMAKHDISTGYKEGTLPYEDVALFSGGHDSLVSTHYTMEELDGDAVLHLDTGTGLPENLEYIKDVCDEFGWELEVRSANKSLEEFAVEWGFPKPPSHSWIYRYFKEHTLSRFVTECEHKPTFYTGVRKDESTRRMENVSVEDEDMGQWIWSSPIAEWSDDDCEAYIDEHNLPRNPVVETIGMSGECFCGAYADRFSELAVLEEEYPEHAEFIYEVEERVQERRDCEENPPLCYWGDTGEMTNQDFDQMDEDRDMMLCKDCSVGGHRQIDVSEVDIDE